MSWQSYTMTSKILSLDVTVTRFWLVCHLGFLAQVLSSRPNILKPQVETGKGVNAEIFTGAAAVFQLGDWMNCAGKLINAALKCGGNKSILGVTLEKIYLDFSTINMTHTHTHAHRVYHATEIYNNKIHKQLSDWQFSSWQLDVWSIKTSLDHQSERLCPCVEVFMLRFNEANSYKRRVHDSKEGDRSRSKANNYLKYFSVVNKASAVATENRVHVVKYECWVAFLPYGDGPKIQ